MVMSRPCWRSWSEPWCHALTLTRSKAFWSLDSRPKESFARDPLAFLGFEDGLVAVVSFEREHAHGRRVHAPTTHADPIPLGRPASQLVRLLALKREKRPQQEEVPGLPLLPPQMEQPQGGSVPVIVGLKPGLPLAGGFPVGRLMQQSIHGFPYPRLFRQGAHVNHAQKPDRDHVDSKAARFLAEVGVNTLTIRLDRNVKEVPDSLQDHLRDWNASIGRGAKRHDWPAGDGKIVSPARLCRVVPSTSGLL